MLQLQAIRDNKNEIVEALKKRNLDASSLLEEVLKLDEKRRATQTRLDSTLAESNKISREIGMLFKSGKAAEANIIKEKTVVLKETSKKLGEELGSVSNELQNLLYQIPTSRTNLYRPEIPMKIMKKYSGKVPSLSLLILPFHIGNWRRNMTL